MRPDLYHDDDDRAYDDGEALYDDDGDALLVDYLDAAEYAEVMAQHRYAEADAPLEGVLHWHEAEDEDAEDGAPEPYWTWRRVVFIAVALIFILMTLAYSLAPLFDQAPLPPPPIPLAPPDRI